MSLTQNATGSVRNTIGSKNFGFVTVEGMDVFVHLKHLHAAGFTKPEFVPGTEVVLDYEEQPDGLFRAAKIHRLGDRDASPPKAKNQGKSRRATKRGKRVTLAVGDIVVGRFDSGCQWEKGYGFVAVIARYEDGELRRFGKGERPKDVFVHVSRCPEELDEAVAAKQPLELRIVEGRSAGQIAGEVMSLHEGELTDAEPAEATSEEEVAKAA